MYWQQFHPQRDAALILRGPFESSPRDGGLRTGPLSKHNGEPMLDDLKADVTAALVGTLRTAALWPYSLDGDDGFGNPVPTYGPAIACEGLKGSYESVLAGLSGIPRTAAKIELLAGTLSVTPSRLDKINIEGGWWIITEIEVDPAGAMWLCQCAETTAE